MVLDPRASGGLVLMPAMLLTVFLQSSDEGEGSWALLQGSGLTEEHLRAPQPRVWRLPAAEPAPHPFLTPPPRPPTPGAPGSPSPIGRPPCNS
jgi:hypothetical protein